MKNIYLILVLTYLPAQMPFDCLFNTTNALNRSGLESNVIIDIRYGSGDTLYIGTGNGLGFADVTYPLSPTFTVVNNPLLPEGGIPALKTYTLNNSNKMIVLSGAISTYETADNVCHARGTGISWSVDNGLSWQYIDQPVDDGDPEGFMNFDWYGETLSKKVWHTTVDNVSYDVAVDLSQNFVYSTSWGGGLRRFNYENNPEWKVIPLPMDNQDSLFCNATTYASHYDNYVFNPVDPPDGSDNHKAFSVYADSNTLWVGTAGGVNKGIVQDGGCIDWIHYNTNDGLGGNWITGIIPQEISDGLETYTRLWLISWTGAPPPPHPLTYTDDEGETWEEVTYFEEQGIVVYNLSFSSENAISNQYIFASTDDGLYYTDIDNVHNWAPKPTTSDINGEIILTEEYYTAISIGEGIGPDTLLIGTADGLSIISTSGETLNNIRFWDSPDIFSAYPNPFFINNQNLVGGYGHVRFIYLNPYESSGEIDIFDFAMDQVIHLDNSNPVTQDENEIVWNGHNEYGDKVANGVYFCRLTLKGKYYWTKLAVIN